jgi:hypothetical protein
VELAAEELIDAKDWDHAKTLAIEWADRALSKGGLSHPTLPHLRQGAKAELVRERKNP